MIRHIKMHILTLVIGDQNNISDVEETADINAMMNAPPIFF